MRALRSLVLAAAGSASVLVARDACAEEPAWRFVYDAQTDGCPSRGQVLSQIVARLGFDPFRGEAEATSELWISLRKDDRGPIAVVERREDGKALGERVLRATSDCVELTAAAALAGSILIDPTGAMARREAPRSAPAPEPGASRAEDPWSEPVTIVAPRRPEPRLGFLLGTRALASAGLAPAPSVGLAIDAALRRDHLEVRLEVRGDLPVESERRNAGAGVSTSLLTGAVAPCWASGGLRLCGVLMAGALLARSDGISPAERDATAFAGVGVRPMLATRLTGPLYLVGSVEGLLLLRRLALELRGEEVWSSPIVAGTAGLGVAVLFP